MILPCAVLLMLWLKSGYVKGLLVPSMLRDPLMKKSSNFYIGCEVSIMLCSPHYDEIFFGRGSLVWERLLMWPSQHHRYKLGTLRNMELYLSHIFNSEKDKSRLLRMVAAVVFSCLLRRQSQFFILFFWFINARTNRWYLQCCTYTPDAYMVTITL